MPDKFISKEHPTCSVVAKLNNLEIKVINLQAPAIKFSKTRKLSEKFAKEYFKKRNHKIWRGDYLDGYGNKNNSKYNNNKIRPYYEFFDKLLIKLFGKTRFARLCAYCSKNHGTPDFFIWCPKTNSYSFVEVKLDDEKLMSHQKKTILFIKNVLRINVMLLRLITRKIAISSKIDLDETNKEQNNQLFEELRKWRLEKSREESIPAYMVLKDITLHEISKQKPTRENDLLKIKGIGSVKLAKYGFDILTLVGKYH